VPGLIDKIHFTANGKVTNPLAWIYDHVLILLPTPGFQAFGFSVLTLAYCFIPVWIMYRKKIFVRV
jgi:hypothetical protein